MTCSFCHYPNLDDERRCRRCCRPLYNIYAAATSGVLAAAPEPRPIAPDHPQPSAQLSLEFLQPVPAAAPRELSTTLEAIINNSAPVASPMHWAWAAAIDGIMILIAYGLFLTVFHLMGGSFPSSRPVILVMGATAILIAMLYGSVWVCAGGQTPGMRALRLTWSTSTAIRLPECPSISFSLRRCAIAAVHPWLPQLDR